MKQARVEIGVVADDFTGASDVANALSKAGLSTTLCFGIPNDGHPPESAALVIALKSRSIPASDAVCRSLDAARWLRSRGSRRIYFKYCSTFDSTPAGNIGPVAEALLDLLGQSQAVVCPAFPETGRTVYSGHLFVGDRLLNESGLERHPINPMTDADIRRWLRLQTSLEVRHIPHSVVRSGALAVEEALRWLSDGARNLVVVDAASDGDIDAIGAAVVDAPLVTGGSALASGIARCIGGRNGSPLSPASAATLDGPAAILSGSCSSASRAQVQRHRRFHPGLEVSAERIIADDGLVDAVVNWCLENRDSLPLVYTSAEPETVGAAQARFGPETLATRIEAFFGEVSVALRRAGFQRIVVGGGETSGAVVTALKVDAVLVGPEIDPGVPALHTGGNPPFGLALKSGNFGSEDFFERAASALKGPLPCSS